MLLPKPQQEASEKHRLVKTETPFKIAFTDELTNGYEIKDMKQPHVREFHRFVSETVYKKMNISDVDKQYLRKQGMSAQPVTYKGIDLLHYGKDRNPFRLFGYYNDDGYFVICRIDGNHETHKE